jgi:hypothetical protein
MEAAFRIAFWLVAAVIALLAVLAALLIFGLRRDRRDD